MIKEKKYYYEDTLTGPPPVLKKPSGIVNQITTFPPPIPPPSQEMTRMSGKIVEKEEKSETISWGEALCAPFGLGGPKHEKKIIKSQEKNQQQAIKTLEDTLNGIYKDRTKQLSELYNAQTQMNKVEGDIFDFLACGGTTSNPIYKAHAQAYDQYTRQHKLAQGFLKLLNDREVETKNLLASLQTEGHSQKIRNAYLQYNNTSQKLGVDQKQMTDILKVNQLKEKQMLRNEVASSLAAVPQVDLIPEYSEDVNMMLRRCTERLQKFNGRSHPPAPPQEPLVDKNMLKKEDEESVL